MYVHVLMFGCAWVCEPLTPNPPSASHKHSFPLPHGTFLCVCPAPLLQEFLAGFVEGLKEPGEREEGSGVVIELADQCWVQGVVDLIQAVVKHCFT